MPLSVRSAVLRCLAARLGERTMGEEREDPEWGRRFAELYRTPARARDTALRIVGFATPTTLVLSLLAVITEGSERRLVVGTYLLTVTIVLLASWAIEPFMAQRVMRRKRGRFLAATLRVESGESAESPDPWQYKAVGEGRSMLSQPPVGFRLEVDQMRRMGISVMALWPFTERFIDDDDRAEIAGVGGRRAANVAVAVGGVLAGVGGWIASLAGAADYDSNELPAFGWSFLVAGQIFLVGGTARASRNAEDLYRRKVELIWRHATRVIATVETPLAGRSPVDRLRSLTAQVLDGAVVLPTASEQVVAASEVATTIKRTVEDALTPAAPINVMGVLRARMTPDYLEVVLITGAEPWSDARRDETDVSSFRVSGGRDEPEMPYELVADPGIVAVDANHAGVIRVDGGEVIVRFSLDPADLEVAISIEDSAGPSELPWISLYSLNRFVHSVQVSPR